MSAGLDLLMWFALMAGGGWIDLQLDVYRRTGRVADWRRLFPWQ